MLRLGEPAQAILDDDDRAIDDQAEVERAEAHQVGRNPVLHHAGDGHQHGQRNDRRSDQCGSDVAKQHEQNDDNEQRALDQIRSHGLDGAVDERGAVVDRRGTHAVGQARIDLVQACRGTPALPRGCSRQPA